MGFIGRTEVGSPSTAASSLKKMSLASLARSLSTMLLVASVAYSGSGTCRSAKRLSVSCHSITDNSRVAKFFFVSWHSTTDDSRGIAVTMGAHLLRHFALVMQQVPLKSCC